MQPLWAWGTYLFIYLLNLTDLTETDYLEKLVKKKKLFHFFKIFIFLFIFLSFPC